MPAPKGSYNARHYHQEEGDVVEEALRRALASLRAGTLFKNVSSLAAHVAPACGRTAGQLRRSARYRAVLEGHLGRQPGAIGLLGDDTRSAPILRAKLIEARLRIANLEADKRRLEAFVSRHTPHSEPTRQAAGNASGPASDYQRAFECTASALEAVIQHAEVYKVDNSSGALIDLAARPGAAPVVSGNMLTYFIKWNQAKRAKI